jgi:nucleotide-binding universal stress UspA family protein
VEFHRILVPVIGTDADEEAIRLACQLAKKNKGKIWAVYVITIKRTLPLDAEMEPEIKKAEGILDHMASVAEKQDYEIETDLLQAREAAPAIVDEAVERVVDLILMGVTYRTRFGQFSLGSVAPYVLKNAPCRVILYQYQYTA